MERRRSAVDAVAMIEKKVCGEPMTNLGQRAYR